MPGRPFIGLAMLAGLVYTTAANAQVDIYDSGGVLLRSQSGYDVRYYDLDVELSPGDSTLAATAIVHARLLRPLDSLVLHLDTTMHVSSVSVDGAPRTFTRSGGLLAITLGNRRSNVQVAATIAYEGRPLASRPTPGSWADGFSWQRTPSGDPWIGLVTVLTGADTWFPVKDHPSDEPDSLTLRVTVPAGLRVASNGVLRSETTAGGRSTFEWHVSTPINNYGVTINAAPYEVFSAPYVSVTGDTMQTMLWLLSENAEHSDYLLAEMARNLRFMEEHVGPYPFRRDKYGVAQTHYLGMEHQSVISYGSNFERNALGFDWLHFHEMVHEWFANQATAADWSDWWLHEGVATYFEALYTEYLQGTAAYHAYVSNWERGARNQEPIAPRGSHSTREVYRGEIYSKGAAVLHTLRYLIGEEALWAAFRWLSYPDGTDVDGCGCHLVTTDGFRDAVARISGRDVSWFFQQYLRSAELPRLAVDSSRTTVRLRWTGVPGFAMPVDVEVNGVIHRVPMTGGRSPAIAVPDNASIVVDPQNWILRQKS